MALDIRNLARGQAALPHETFQGPDSPSDDDLSTCVHCGLCLNYCPTFRVTGLETESPRGRIYLMTQWKRGGLPFTEDQVRHIDLCRSVEQGVEERKADGLCFGAGGHRTEQTRPRSR